MTTLPRRSAGFAVGIDQSYSGFAVVCLPRSGAPVRATLSRFSDSNGVDRLLDIEMFLTTFLLHNGPVEAVCMEGYAAGAKFGREKAGELGYAVKRTLLLALGPKVGYPTIVAPTSVKKFTTGSGASRKSEMIKAVYKRWGYDTSDDNVADAYALARIAHALVWPPHDLPKFQAEVLHSLVEHTEQQHEPGGGTGTGR